MYIFIKKYDEIDVILYKKHLVIVDSAVHLKKKGLLVQYIEQKKDAKPYFLDIHIKKNQLKELIEICENTSLKYPPIYTTGNLGDPFLFQLKFQNDIINHYETYVSKPFRFSQICIPYCLFSQIYPIVSSVIIYGLNDSNIQFCLENEKLNKIDGLNFTI